MAKELKPCPFCGGNDLTYHQDFSEGEPRRWYAWHVFCTDCHACGRNNFPIGWCESKEAAAEAWNTRATQAPDAQAERVRVLEAALRNLEIAACGVLSPVASRTEFIHLADCAEKARAALNAKGGE